MQVYGGNASVAIPLYTPFEARMSTDDLWPYLGAGLSAASYALWLETRPRKYHPDVVWPNVLGGIALTGAWVAVRFAIEARPRSLAWAWWVVFRMFVATGLPVVGWEEFARTERGRVLVAYLRSIHRDEAKASREPRRRVA